MLKEIKRRILLLGDYTNFNAKSFILNVICLAGIITLSISTFKSLQIGIARHNLIKTEEESLNSAKDLEYSLEKDLEWYQSLEFIEGQSRDYLNYGREGESVLIIPGSFYDGLENEKEEETLRSVGISIDLWLDLLFK